MEASLSLTDNGYSRNPMYVVGGAIYYKRAIGLFSIVGPNAIPAPQEHRLARVSFLRLVSPAHVYSCTICM